ncbi:MAG: DUF3493 domain-containing protein [Thermosynechococcaceae cyanobacterium]
MPPLTPEQQTRLRAEVAAPYRGLRRFTYLALGGSASIGAFVFLMKAIAGETLERTLPNLALQVAVGLVMLWLWRRDRSSQ